MKKILFQGIAIAALFFMTWFLLSQVNWVDLFRVQKITDKTEQRTGDLFWDFFRKTENEIKNPFVVNSIDSIVTKICNANHIDRERIKIHILKKDDVNAFALPNGHLIIYDGLILASDNQEELSGVIGHEMAHIVLSHVMKKLVKDVGIASIVSMTSGKGGTEIIKEAVKKISSTAFDRKMEKEADIKAVDYLLKAKINPEPFADFLFMISEKENDAMKYFAWINTHPDSKERAENIIEYSKNKKVDFKSVLNIETWDGLKEKLKD